MKSIVAGLIVLAAFTGCSVHTRTEPVASTTTYTAVAAAPSYSSRATCVAAGGAWTERRTCNLRPDWGTK